MGHIATEMSEWEGNVSCLGTRIRRGLGKMLLQSPARPLLTYLQSRERSVSGRRMLRVILLRRCA